MPRGTPLRKPFISFPIPSIHSQSQTTSRRRRELSPKLPTAPVSISTFESGASDMRARTVIKLCAALGVTIVYRIDQTEITGP
jgi:hypothetical protein